MASDRTRELAKGWMEQASHRYHRHDVTGMGPDCEVCVESLAALLEAFERETRLDEHRMHCHATLLQYDSKSKLTGNVRCGDGWECGRRKELESRQLPAQSTPEVKK